MKVLLMLFWILASGIALAQYQSEEKPFYAGLRLGISDYDDLVNCSNCNGLRAALNDTSEHGLSSGVVFGYQWTKYVAFEGNYYHFGDGDFGISSEGPIGSETQKTNLKLRSQGLAGFLKGVLPISPRWQLFAKLGWHYYDLQAETRIIKQDVEEPVVVRKDFEDSDVAFGLGFQFHVGNNFVLGFEGESYAGDAPGPGDNGVLFRNSYPFQNLTASLAYKF